MPRIPIHLIVAGSSWVSRGVSAVSAFVSLRLLLVGLGTEGYAIYALLAGLTGWYALVELGLGASLQNYISERRAHDEPYADLIVRSAAIALCVFAGALVLLFAVGHVLGPAYLKVAAIPDADKTRYMMLSGGLLVASSLGGISYRVWYAEQRGYLANIAPAAAAVSMVLGIALVSKIEPADKLLWYLLASQGPQAAIGVAAYAAMALKALRARVPAPPGLTQALAGRAIQFWFVLGLGTVSVQLDYLVISQFLSAEEVNVYNVAYKIFDVITLLYTAFLSALWPTFTELITRDRWDEVFRHLRRYLLLGMLGLAAMTLVMVAAMPAITRLLSPSRPLEVPVSFILLLGGSVIIRSWANTWVTVLQSMSRLRGLWLVLLVQASINVVLQLVLAPRYGIQGVTVSVILAYSATSAWVLPLLVLRRSRGNV